jgi:hypothetical protein
MTTQSALCQCGCGLPAPIARRTWEQWGHVKGQPMRWRRGHNPKFVHERACCDSCGQSFVRKVARERWCATCGPDKAARHRLSRFGLAQPEYEAILAEQEGHCALCDGPPEAVDHDHETGIVRGLLCTWCNTRLHVFDHKPEWVEAAAAYLKSTQGATRRRR